MSHEFECFESASDVDFKMEEGNKKHLERHMMKSRARWIVVEKKTSKHIFCNLNSCNVFTKIIFNKYLEISE